MQRKAGFLGWLVAPAAMLSSTLVVPASLSTGTDGEARLPYWELRDEGVSIRLVQRLPDQTRAFFLARGFGARDVEIIATSCVFQTVFRNISDAARASPVEYDLQEWVVHHDGGSSGMQTREHWRDVWRERDAPKPARIAFEWALFPTRQVYRPGDYNWGMSIFGLKPGSSFDLQLVWRQFDATHTATIENVQCAADTHAEADAP